MKAFFAVVLAFFSVVAWSQTAQVAAQPNTIFSGADGKFEAAPDTAVMNLDISSQQDFPRSL